MGWISTWWKSSIFPRPPELSISEDTECLIIKVSLRGKKAAVLLSALVMTTFVVIAVNEFIGQPVLVVIAALGALLGAMISLRERTVELLITNLEFETIGYFGGSYRHRRTEPRMSIVGLEYRSGCEGVPGLYAEMLVYRACLLPYVTEQQANDIIERIYRRFPDTPVATDPFKENLTTLNLE